MSTDGTIKRHAALVDRMANALGIDLEEKMMEGKLQMDALGDVVLSCTGCIDPDRCDHWLGMQAQTATATPPMCRNADIFERLKADKRV